MRYTPAVKYVSYHDLLAGVVAVILLLAVLALVFLERPVPDFLSGAFVAVIGYAVRGGVQVANDASHRRKNNGQP